MFPWAISSLFCVTTTFWLFLLAPEPRAGVRQGHIPGARNVHFSTLLNADGTMKPAAELAKVFQAAGVDFEKYSLFISFIC